MADMFIKIGSVPGESPDEIYAGSDGWIQVEDWSWGMSQEAAGHVGTGIGAAKAHVSDIDVRHRVDAASAELMKHCCKGTHHPEAELIVRKAGGAPLDFLKIKMGHVLIAGVNTAGAGANELMETVSLHFQEVKVTYTAQDASGASMGEHIFTWNVPKNSENTSLG